MTTGLATKTLDIEGVISGIESVPNNQKPQKAFQVLAQQMQQSGDSSLQSWGQQLQQGSPQLVKAIQQG